MTKHVDFISKCDSYYNMCHLLQNASAQRLIQAVVVKEKREYMKDLSYEYLIEMNHHFMIYFPA